MNKKLTAISILFLSVAVFAIIALANNQKEPMEPMMADQASIQRSDSQEASGIVLYYGEDCPHCAIVEEFVTQNNIEIQVPFIKKEVYYNSQNANDLASKAKACGMPTNSIGVPFLWDGLKCFMGDQEIIEFFKLKANIQ